MSIPYIPVRQTPVNGAGTPYASATRTFYRAGTTTLLNAYADNARTTPLANPQVADSAGRFTAAYLDPTYDYRVVLKDAAGNTLADDDYVPSSMPVTAASIGAALYPRTTEEIAASVTPSNYNYPPGDVRRYGADPTGTNDSSTAIQAALTVGGAVFIPRGTYDIGTALDVTGNGRLIYGEGSELSVLNITGTNDCLTSNDTYLRVTVRGLSIQGGATSGRGIYFDQDGSTEFTYDSLFDDLYITTGKQAIYLPGMFSCTFINVRGSSSTEHVFEVLGGPAVSFINCYAKTVPASKVGYRVYGGATFIACNGIDSPGNSGARWGLFGQNTAKGDAVDNQYYCTFIGCNFEDFNDYGLQFRYNGNAVLTNCTFFAKASGTYQAAVLVEYNDKGMEFNSVTFGTKGATRSKLAYVYSDSGCYATALHGNWDGVDLAGSLINGPTANFGYPENNEAAWKFRNVEITRKAHIAQAHLTAAAGSAASGVVALGNGTQTTVGTAGAASALPANPSGFLKIYIGSTQYVIPYYKQA